MSVDFGFFLLHQIKDVLLLNHAVHISAPGHKMLDHRLILFLRQFFRGRLFGDRQILLLNQGFYFNRCWGIHGFCDFFLGDFWFGDFLFGDIYLLLLSLPWTLLRLVLLLFSLGLRRLLFLTWFGLWRHRNLGFPMYWLHACLSLICRTLLVLFWLYLNLRRDKHQIELIGLLTRIAFDGLF